MVEALTAAVAGTAGGPMLNERMQQGYQSGVDELAGSDLVELAATGTDPAQGYSVVVSAVIDE